MRTATRKALPTIHLDRCTGCGWCIAACPPHVLSLQVQGTGRWGPKRSTLHDEAGCTGCALCAVRCPFDAIRMVRTAAEDHALLKGVDAGTEASAPQAP